MGTLDTAQVTVATPLVSTDISFAVVTDEESATTAMERLQEPQVMAQALSAATGTDVSAADVVTAARSTGWDSSTDTSLQSDEDGEDSVRITINVSKILIILA